MGGIRIALLSLTLAGLAATSAAAQDPAGTRTIFLPHNMARERSLADEAYRHDRAVEHIRHNTRQLEFTHKRTLENIQKEQRLNAADKARRIADENQRFEVWMRAQQRQLAIAEQEHAKNEAEIRARHTEPGDKEQSADRFDAEGSMLGRARAVADEDMRHESAVAHLDGNRRALEAGHERRLKSIADEQRLPADAKALESAEENGRFAVDMRHLDRQRDLVEKEHQNRRAAIDARFGNPNPGGDVFAAQGDPTPPARPGPAQTDSKPVEGGISGGRTGGRAVTGPTGRPPSTGGTDQIGTGGVGQPQPGPGPTVLKGRVEENVGAPPVAETPQQPCSQEWVFGEPDVQEQFVQGLTASIAQCVESDWAMMPVAGPLAYVAAKQRMVALVLNAITRASGAMALYQDLQKQRPKGECAYDTGLWYAQLVCDANQMAAKAPDDPSFGGRQRGGLDPVRPARPVPEVSPKPAQQTAAPSPRAPQQQRQEAAARTDPYREKGRAAQPREAPGGVCSMAKEDCVWRALRNATGDPSFERNFDGPRPRSWPEVYALLKENFGGRLPDARSPSHDNGIPVPMSHDEIVDYLRDKEGAEGIVFVFYANGESHALNVANFKRHVVFMDDQKQFWPGDAPYLTVEQALKGKVVSSLFYRTR